MSADYLGFALGKGPDGWEVYDVFRSPSFQGVAPTKEAAKELCRRLKNQEKKDKK